MIDNMNIDIRMKNERESSPNNKRTIVSYAHLERKINLMPWEDNIKKAFLDRAKKYPEAALDYMWKNINDYLKSAMKDISGKTAIVKPKKQDKKEEVSRPSFFDEENI